MKVKNPAFSKLCDMRKCHFIFLYKLRLISIARMIIDLEEGCAKMWDFADI